MQDGSRPRRRARKPRAKAETSTPGATAAAPTGAPGDRNPAPPPPAFDHLVADDGYAQDFDRLASNNPRSAVVSALAVGIAIGFVAGLLIARD